MPLIEPLSTDGMLHYFAADYLSVRSPGAHMKTIIDDYIEHHDLTYRKKTASGFTVDDLGSFAALGFAWERSAVRALLEGGVPTITDATPAAVRRIYERAFEASMNEAERIYRPRELVRPGEIEIDGIFCTCDGINNRLGCIEEWKCTWVSAARPIDEARPDWMMQIPGYCYAHGFEWAILRVFYVNGIYEKGGRMGAPIIRVYRITWDTEELEENWDQIVQHRGVMEREGRMEIAA